MPYFGNSIAWLYRVSVPTNLGPKIQILGPSNREPEDYAEQVAPYGYQILDAVDVADVPLSSIGDAIAGRIAFEDLIAAVNPVDAPSTYIDSEAIYQTPAGGTVTQYPGTSLQPEQHPQYAAAHPSEPGGATSVLTPPEESSEGFFTFLSLLWTAKEIVFG